MSVIRVKKTTDYTIMSNTHFKEKEMSLKAKGLLSLMLSLPDEWDYSINGLVLICKENETAIRNTLSELEHFKYLKRERKQNKQGRFEYEYTIYEKPNTEKPYIENPYADNPTQLNTNISNTNKLNTNNKKKERKTSTGYDEILSKIENEELKDLYLEYIKMRKFIKSPMTDRALTLLINKVNKLEPTNIDRQKQLLETAIVNNWKSVYPIKDNQNQPQKDKNEGWCFVKEEDDLPF